MEAIFRILTLASLIFIGLADLLPLCVAATPYQLRYSDPLNQPWRISRFRELEGRGLRCVTEDSSGNMWFGINRGVVRYDGYEWQTFAQREGLPSRPVEALTTRKDGRLIAATEAGLHQFDGKRWTVVPGLENCPLPTVAFVKESTDGTLWVGCGWGLLRIKDKTTTIITSESYERALRQLDRFDAIETFPNHCLSTRDAWGGTGIRLVGQEVAFLADESPAKEAGLRLGDRVLSVNDITNQHIRTLQRKPGLPVQLKIQRQGSKKIEELSFVTRRITSTIHFPSIHSLLEDSHGQLWVGTNGNRLIRSNDGGASWERVEGGPDFRLGIRPAAAELSNGDILVVSAGRNSAAYRFNGQEWTKSPLYFLTGTNFTSSIRETVDGTIWVSGLDRIYVYTKGSWVKHDTRDLDLPGDGNRMFIASDDALWLVGQGQYAARIALSPNECFTLEGVQYQCTDAQGAQWFIEQNTNRIIRRDNQQTVAFDKTDNITPNPTGIKPTPNGVVAVGSDRRTAGLSVYDGERWHRETFPEVATEFSGPSIYVTEVGQIWVAAAGERIKNQVGGVVSGYGTEWRHHRPPEAPRTATSIVGLDDASIMVAGAYGISTFDGQQWKRVTDDLFVNNRCPSVDTDSAGTIWIASATRGVIRSKGTQWESLATEFGLDGFGVNKIAASSADAVWAGTSRGVFRFDGDRFHRINLPHAVGRRSLKLGESGSIWLDGRHCLIPSKTPPRVTVETDEITVEHGGRSVIALSSLDAWNRTDAANLSYSSKLDDREWTPFTKDHLLVLEGLTAGKHSVRIRARDEEFNVSTNEKVLSISVAPPFWLTPTFLAMCTLALTAVIWQTYRLTVRGKELRHANLQLKAAQKRLEGEIAQTSAQFRAVCDCSPVGIFVADTETRLTYANHRMQEIMGVSDEASALEHGWTQALHPDDRASVLNGWREAMSKGDRFHCQGRLIHRDHHHVYFELVADCINRDEEVLGYVCAVEDITEKRRAEQELRNTNSKLVKTLDELEQAQALALKQERLGALGQMAAGVAHDINNALSPLLSYAELLGEETPKNDRAKHWIGLIRLGIGDMAETVRRLDHFYRKAHHRDELSTVDVVELAKQTIALTKPRWENDSTRDGKKIDVVVEASSSPSVNAVASQIRSVLTNLIFNSVDAIEDSGSVTIRISHTDQKAVLEIEDTGCGMNQEQLSRCLDPFYTSKQKGSGLGLSECHGIIRQHGGTMQISSTEGLGTNVKVELPLDPHPESADPTAPSSSGPKPLAKIESNVLYVDDDEMVRRSVKAILERMGLQVTLASDGNEALQLLSHTKFPLIISDYGLPGMNGGELLKEVKMKSPETPVIIVSGWSNPISSEEPQPDAYLKKPFTITELSDVLKTFLPANDQDQNKV